MPALEKKRSIGPLALLGARDQRADVLLAADVGAHGEPADLLGDRRALASSRSATTTARAPSSAKRSASARPIRSPRP